MTDEGDEKSKMDSLIRCSVDIIRKGDMWIKTWSSETEQGPPPTTPSYP